MIGANIIDANSFKNNSVQKRYLDEHIQEIIININNELKVAQKSGNYVIITEIPIIFDIPNMNNKDAQRIIWCSLIEILKNKHYIVNINHSKDSCRLKISWLNEEDKIKIKSQVDILTACTLNF